MNIKIDTQKDNPLIQSYQDGDINKFRQLIKDGMNVNCIDNNNFSLIYLVISGQEDSVNKEFFNILMENNVHLNPIGRSGNLLFPALVMKRKFFFKELLDNGIDIDARNKNSNSDYYREHMIFQIMKAGDYYYIDLILNKKLTTCITNKYGDTILTGLINFYSKYFSNEQSADILRRFIDLGEQVNERGQNGMMPIHYVAIYKLNHLLDVLLEDSADTDLNSRDMMGNTALIYTTSKNNFEATKKLIKKGANLSILNAENESALFLSIKNGCEKIFNLLIDNNAAVLTIDKNGNNILHRLILLEWSDHILDAKYYKKIINKHPELLFKKNKDEKSPIDLLAMSNDNHRNKKFINSLVGKLDKFKFTNNEGMSL